jgi:hypothetical protein
MKTDDSSKIQETKNDSVQNDLNKKSPDYFELFLQLQDKNFNVYQKFVERSQWLMTGLITIIIFSVGVFAVVQWDFQKNTKEELQKEIDNRLGKLNAKPKLDIFNINGQPLENSEVHINRIVIQENKTSTGKKLPFSGVKYSFPVVYKNTGEGEVDFIRVKVYSNDFLLNYVSSNKKYKKEDTSTAYVIEGREFPLLVKGQVESTNINLNELRDVNKKTKNDQIRLPNGKYNLLMELLHPNEEKMSINFTLIIDENTQIIDLNKP